MSDHDTPPTSPPAGPPAGPPALAGARPAAEPLDRLSIVGLEARGHHGVFDFERREGQVFRVDLTLGVDTRMAAASDDLADTVDYGVLADRVRRAVETDPVDLIETLAQRIADLCLSEARVAWAEVTVHKPDAPIEGTFSDVTLTIHRSRA